MDLTGFRTTSFAGGGLIGVALYMPIAFLFSNVGTYFIGSILILAGALLVSPWSVYDIAEFSVEDLPNGGKVMSVEKKNALSNKKKKLVKRLRKRLD